MKRAVLASLCLLLLLAACGPTTTPAAAPATAAPAAATSAPTAVPATATSVPPTSAPTAVPPTPTSVPPTATALPATPTFALPSPTSAPATAVAVKNEFVVNVKNFEFMPRDIKIAAGTTVTWVVLEAKHTTTSDDFRTKGPNSWHSGDLSAGQKFSFTFNTPGAYRFFCGFHSEPGAPLTVGNMNGLVTVQ